MNEKELREAVGKLADEIEVMRSKQSVRESRRPVKISCGCSFDGNQFYYCLCWRDGEIIWKGSSDLAPEGFADEFFKFVEVEEIKSSIIFIVNKSYIVKEVKTY